MFTPYYLYFLLVKIRNFDDSRPFDPTKTENNTGDSNIMCVNGTNIMGVLVLFLFLYLAQPY